MASTTTTTTTIAPPQAAKVASSASSSSVAVPPGSSGVDRNTPDNGREFAITVKNNKFLTLQGGALVLELDEVPKKDKSSASPSLLCGMPLCGAESDPPTTQTIPLYNILWAERKSTQLEITHAEPLPNHKLRPATITVDASATGEAVLDSWIETLMSRAYGRAKQQKRIKVLVNPHAGPGGAMNKWQHDVEPIFRAAKMMLDVQQTTHSGEAVGIARDLDIEKFDAIAACSGDGLPYEIWNGLGERPDARRALQKLAVLQIPCGSGNGLALNICGSQYPSEAGLAIVKGIDTPMDLMSVTFGDERKLSFHSQTLGLMAELDLGTEHLRWMGDARFHWGFITRVIKKKAYPCQIDMRLAMDDKDEIRRHYKGEMEANDAFLATGESQLVLGRPRNTPKAAVIGADDFDTAESEALPPLKYGTVKDQLKENWVTVDSKKVTMLYVGKIALLAPDCNFFPASTPNDGYIDMAMVDNDTPLMTMVGLEQMIAAEGSYFSSPYVTYRKVLALRITPKDQKDGYVTIDGEAIPFGPIQVEVHPGLGKVYSKSGGYEIYGPAGWKDV